MRRSGSISSSVMGDGRDSARQGRAVKGCEVLEQLGSIKDVKTATGCASPRRRARRLSFKLLEISRTLQEAVWWL